MDVDDNLRREDIALMHLYDSIAKRKWYDDHILQSRCDFNTEMPSHRR
jgi:hypothetical protein